MPNGMTDAEVETYTTWKTGATALLDLGMLAANLSQLRTMIVLGSEQDFYTVILVFVPLAVFLQLVVAFLLLWNGTLDVMTAPAKWYKNPKIVNFIATGLIAVVLAFNVVIASFGIEKTQTTT